MNVYVQLQTVLFIFVRGYTIMCRYSSMLITIRMSGLLQTYTQIIDIMTQFFFFEKKIYFHKTNLQKNHAYNTKHTIYKRKEIKAKKRLEILKEGRKRNGGSHYVIQTIERHNPFKLFSLYTFYAID